MKPRKHPELVPGNWVRVRWEDAYVHDQGWVKIEDIDFKTKGVQVVISVGLVVRRDPKQVIIAMSKGQDDSEVGTTLAIPMGWIKATELLPQLGAVA